MAPQIGKLGFLPSIAALAFLLLSECPAEAHDPAAALKPAQLRPGVRYTSGVVTSSGWEKSLTDGDPNLKRWNWSAMTSFTQSQSYIKVAPGAYLKQKRQSEAAAIKPQGSIYVRPRHMPTIVKAPDATAASKTRRAVTAHLSSPRPVKARSYDISYRLPLGGASENLPLLSQRSPLAGDSEAFPACGRALGGQPEPYPDYRQAPGSQGDDLACRQVHGRLVRMQ